MVRKNVFSQVGLFWPFFWSDGYNNKQIENDPFIINAIDAENSVHIIRKICGDYACLCGDYAA